MSDPALTELVERLAVVRARFDAGTDDWRFLLLHALRDYAGLAGIDHKLTDPILVMMFDAAAKISQERNPRGRPLDNRTFVKAMTAAAASTLFKRDGYETIEKAVAAVARRSGLSSKEIMVFRNNINRGKVGKDIPGWHDKWKLDFESWPSEKILSSLDRLKIFVT